MGEGGRGGGVNPYRPSGKRGMRPTKELTARDTQDGPKPKPKGRGDDREAPKEREKCK